MTQPHRFSGMTVAEILRLKKASVRNAPLEAGSPTWEEIEGLAWEEISLMAAQSLPGYKTIRKLLSDRRFDR
ncbi:MAG: hypothetical protein HY000_34435 [Planctomycetes bacterium]|nr:hypothetical protein [Planctomycetota bacterium]